MKRVLITGAGSYIGQSLEAYLMQWPEEYSVETVDVRNGKWRQCNFEGYDVVFHVAGIAHIKETRANEALYYTVNRDLTEKIAQMAKLGHVSQFVFLSTMSVYGIEEGIITKTTDPNPTTNYGRSKLQAEEILREMEDAQFKVAILRPPMIYGKNCKGNYQRLRQIALSCPFFPKCSNQRSMLYIDNLCAFVKQIIAEEKSGRYFPQNAEYVCTSDMVTAIVKYHNKRCILVPHIEKMLNAIPLLVAKKAFGTLIYEKMDCVSAVSFEESIRRSES